MDLGDKVRIIVLGITIPVSPALLTLGSVLGIEYLSYHNSKQVFVDKTTEIKVDGINALTSFTEFNDGRLQITRETTGTVKVYLDINGDFRVDKIEETRYPLIGEPFRISLDRGKDYATQDFHEADEDFRNQVQRFRPELLR